MDNTESYGRKFEYDPLWEGPMKQQRVTTDFKGLISFVIFLFCLGAISIYAFRTGNIDNLRSHSSSDKFDFGRTSHKDKHTLEIITHNIWPIFGLALLGGFLALAYIVLLRYHAKLIIYTAMIAFSVGLLILSIGLIAKYTKNNDKYTLYGSIAAAISFVCIVCLMIFCRRKIRIACEVVKESSKAFIYFPSSMLFPIVPFILYSIATSFLGSTVFYLYAIPKSNEHLSGGLMFLILIHVFGYFWICNFISGFAQMTLSGTFATWFWTFNKDYVPEFTLLRSMIITARYHLGTISFGSLIVSIVEFINYLLKVAERSSEDSDECGTAMKCLICCCRFFCTCIEDLIRFINRNAYIMCAVHGTDFIQSAKDAFNLIKRNVLQTVIVSDVTSALTFLGMLIVFGVSLFGSHLYFTHDKFGDDRSTLMVTSAILVFFFILPIFNVLSVSIDTIFLCVLEDYERNDGSVERPHYMSPKLKRLLFK